MTKTTTKDIIYIREEKREQSFSLQAIKTADQEDSFDVEREKRTKTNTYAISEDTKNCAITATFNIVWYKKGEKGCYDKRD